MSVDEAGEQGRVTQVDDAGSLRMLDGGADGNNAFSLDKNLPGLEEGSGIDLKQARGVKHDGRGGGLLGGGIDKNQGRSADEQNEVARQMKSGHGYDYAAFGRGCRWGQWAMPKNDAQNWKIALKWGVCLG